MEGDVFACQMASGRRRAWWKCSAAARRGSQKERTRGHECREAEPPQPGEGKLRLASQKSVAGDVGGTIGRKKGGGKRTVFCCIVHALLERH